MSKETCGRWGETHFDRACLLAQVSKSYRLYYSILYIRKNGF